MFRIFRCTDVRAFVAKKSKRGRNEGKKTRAVRIVTRERRPRVYLEQLLLGRRSDPPVNLEKIFVPFARENFLNESTSPFFLEKKGNETILSSPKIKMIEKSFSSATRAWNMRVVFVHRSGIKSGENRRGRRLVGAPRYIVRAIYRNDDDRKGRRVPRWDNVAIRV